MHKAPQPSTFYPSNVSGANRHRLLLGAIADDVTGAADLAGMLREGGARTALLLGLPGEVPALEADAVVVALKTRSIPAAEARRQSLEALRLLQALGARQILFKYCSTFDSTSEGNIGPVAEALLDALGAAFTVAVPALPVNGRTQYAGHLFVHGTPISETHMRDHPANPMTDANLVRHLQAQMTQKAGLISFDVVRQGAGAIREAMRRLEETDVAVALVDVLSDEDLSAIAEAALNLTLVTGGSGIGGALADVWHRRGWLEERVGEDDEQATGGVLVLAGSCSEATLRQLDLLRGAGLDGSKLDVRRLLEDEAAEVERLVEASAAALAEGGAALVYSSAPTDERARVLEEARRRGHDAERVRTRIEVALAAVAERLIREADPASRAGQAVGAVVVAGGETTGAVAERLGLGVLRVGAALDPGVPVLHAPAHDLGLVFKSGNFGGDDFFVRALRHFGAGAQLGRGSGDGFKLGKEVRM